MPRGPARWRSCRSRAAAGHDSSNMRDTRTRAGTQVLSRFRDAEQLRLEHAPSGLWKKWGPYLSERQWGTVREDYSESGDARNYFTHDHARSRAYRWGED